jgi:hypothetical protein
MPIFNKSLVSDQIAHTYKPVYERSRPGTCLLFASKNIYQLMDL